MAKGELRRVPIQKRAVFVGDIIVVNGYRSNRTSLQEHFIRGGYSSQETPHFLLFTRSETPSTVLVHFFSFEEMNADIKHYLIYELKPLGILRHSSDFGEILSGIIGSFFPEDARFAWHKFGAQTLQRFLLFLSTARTPTIFDYYATIGTFANRYQRVCELCVGESLLDVGSESGMLPLLIAERMPFMKRVVGTDIQMGMLHLAQDLAQERHLTQVQFVRADLLQTELLQLGTFDTVTCLHVIEHFTEDEMYLVLRTLLQMTAQRLLLAVPFEEQPEVLFDHKQVFTPTKLQELGQWCINHLDGKAHLWCEECDGGLLLLERSPSIK